jgi:23S rRNA (cytosine1962-C5)-methyltransferase
MSSVPVLRLIASREKLLLKRHPWVWSGSLVGNGDNAASLVPGSTVRVESASGAFLCHGSVSPASQIRVRALSFDPHERIDDALFRRRVDAAVAFRAALKPDSNAVRLVHGEADGLPGVVVDRFDDLLVVQLSTAGAVFWRDAIASALRSATGLTRIFERSDADVLRLEGLQPSVGWLRGDGSTRVAIREGKFAFVADVKSGQKTGFYLDQRDNRRRTAELIARTGVRGPVLDCFSFSGGFSVFALSVANVTKVTSVDSSSSALALARENVALNGLGGARHECVAADVNDFLRLQQPSSAAAIVLDPPKFLTTAAHVDRAARAYKDLNMLALRVLQPGGLLFTFSCSGGISADLFHKIVAGAAMDAQIDAAIVERVGAAADHPVSLFFPESEYLSGLVLRRKQA